MSQLDIQVAYDVVCPWCWIGKRHLDDAMSIDDATRDWLADWLQLTHIATHRDFNGDITECPGDNLAAYMPRFAAATNLTIGTEGYVPPS